MNVELVVATPDAEKLILYIARVSSDQDNGDSRLIGYLVRNRHWSPFEHAHMTLEITTSRAIAAQILRHRSFTFQEFSQRYASPESYEAYGARRQGETNRQGSINDLNESTKSWWIVAQQEVWTITKLLYDRAIREGVARESARMILPLNTVTKLYMTGSIRSWIHYFDLRCDEHTQQEHREIADAAKQIFIEQFPTISEALNYA